MHLRMKLSERGTMQIDLSDADARVLRETLEAYLPSLRWELARTEARDLRHALVQREELIDRLVFALRDSPGPVVT